MPINIISWNIKSFASCLRFGAERLEILKQVMFRFDLICIYEVPNSVNGTNALTQLVNDLNNMNVGVRTYASFSVATGGFGKENDRIGVIYETATVAVTNTTGTRQPGGFGGRAPIYFDVTELANTNVREFCAWHAPEPKKSSHLIAQGWQNILHNIPNTIVLGRNTAVILGDFNGVLSVPTRGLGSNLVRQIAPGQGNGTTLKPAITTSFNTTQAYRTANTYDQYFVAPNHLTAVGNVGVYEIMSKLASNAVPFTNVFGQKADTPYKAYLLYKLVSDHLPVAITLTL